MDGGVCGVDLARASSIRRLRAERLRHALEQLGPTTGQDDRDGPEPREQPTRETTTELAGPSQNQDLLHVAHETKKPQGPGHAGRARALLAACSDVGFGRASVGNTQLAHLAAEGAGIDAEHLGRAVFPLDTPIRLPQHRPDVVGHGFVQRAELGSDRSRWHPARGTRLFSRNEAVELQRSRRIQNERALDHVWELLPLQPGRGLALLPSPSEGDVFFDIEGDPFVGAHGLEYLLGWVQLDAGSEKYRGIWSRNREQERVALEAFVGAMMAQ